MQCSAVTSAVQCGALTLSAVCEQVGDELTLQLDGHGLCSEPAIGCQTRARGENRLVKILVT